MALEEQQLRVVQKGFEVGRCMNATMHDCARACATMRRIVAGAPSARMCRKMSASPRSGDPGGTPHSVRPHAPKPTSTAPCQV